MLMTFTDTRLGFEERENLLRRENKDLLMRSHELEEQNKALLDQFTQLSDKMAALQTKLSVPGVIKHLLLVFTGLLMDRS